MTKSVMEMIRYFSQGVNPDGLYLSFRFDFCVIEYLITHRYYLMRKENMRDFVQSPTRKSKEN
jgi:hypothetical protein